MLSGEEGLALKGEHRECAVLVAGLRGFKVHSEHLPPEHLVSDLNEFFGRMADVVHDHQGTLDKFNGDSLQAVWGAPVPFEDKELRALKCALDLHAALGDLNRERLARGALPLDLGIGINAGIVVSGNLGSERRVDYTIIGSEVAVAQKLCGLAASGETLVTESIRNKCKDLMVLQLRDPLTVEGATEPLKVYAATGRVS
jgi:adenylate cyclase